MVCNVKDFGAVGDGSGDDAPAIRRALSTGACIYFPEGIYSVDLKDGPFILSYGQQIYGDGYSWAANGRGTTIRRSDDSAFPTFSLTQGGNIVKLLLLQGHQHSVATGIGIEIGGTSYSDYNSIQEVVCQYFAVGVNLRSARWTDFFDCRFDSNQYGERFYATGSMSSSMVTHYSCSFSENQRNGIVAAQVPVRNLGLAYYSCSIENNSTDSIASPGTLYTQCDLGIAGNVVFECCYFEHGGVIKPDVMNISGMSQFTISNSFFNGAKIHILSTAVIDDGLITTSRFGATTNQNTAVSLAAENIRIHAISNISDKTIILNGTTSTLVTSKIAQI